jgi:hypothetical protein
MKIIPLIKAHDFLKQYADDYLRFPEFSQCAEFVKRIIDYVDARVVLNERGQRTLPDLIENTFFYSRNNLLKNDAREIATLINASYFKLYKPIKPC